MKTETYEINLDSGKLEIIRIGYQQLCGYALDGRVPSQALQDDIRAYKAILDAPDAEARADAYIEEKKGNPLLRPRYFARSKGWI